MAVYQGTPLPRVRGSHTQPKRAALSPRVPDRPPVPVRVLSRPATPAYGIAVPRVAAPRVPPAQHVLRLRTMAGPRSRTALVGVAIVLVVTFVGLFYLSQIFTAAAARYEVQRLTVERQVMLQLLQTQRAETVRLGSESTVTQWAQDGNLLRLGQPIRVRAR